MADQTTWIDLKDRTEEIQELVLQVGRLSSHTNTSSEHLYREYNWGLTGNPVLCSALLRMRDSGVLQNHQEILSERGTYTDPSTGNSGVQEEENDIIGQFDSDPLIKLKSREIDLRAMENQQKHKENEDRLNLDKMKTLLNQNNEKNKLAQNEDLAKLRASVSLAKQNTPKNTN